MIKNFFYDNWIVIVTLLLALLLDILPLPISAIWIRPNWTILVLLYWFMALPEYINIKTAFFIGLILDLLKGTVFGLHAVALIVISYIMLKFCKIIRVYPLIQQALFVFLFILFYKIMVFSLQGFVGRLSSSLMYWVSPLVSAILWPWLFVVLRDCRRRVKMY